MIHRITTTSALRDLRRSLQASREGIATSITLCGGTGCLASGAGEVARAFKEELKKRDVDGRVAREAAPRSSGGGV